MPKQARNGSKAIKVLNHGSRNAKKQAQGQKRQDIEFFFK